MGVLEKELLVVIMATYVYNHCGMSKEITQSITETLIPPKCDICNADMQREYNSFGISFKGNGFYVTDK